MRATVLAAREEGFAVNVIGGGSRRIDAERGARATDEMKAAGARFVAIG